MPGERPDHEDTEQSEGRCPPPEGKEHTAQHAEHRRHSHLQIRLFPTLEPSFDDCEYAENNEETHDAHDHAENDAHER